MSANRIIDSYAIDGEGVVLLIERVTSDRQTYGSDGYTQTDIDWVIVHERLNGDQDQISTFNSYRG
jgi:hypothetical protein